MFLRCTCCTSSIRQREESNSTAFDNKIQLISKLKPRAMTSFIIDNYRYRELPDNTEPSKKNIFRCFANDCKGLHPDIYIIDIETDMSKLNINITGFNRHNQPVSIISSSSTEKLMTVFAWQYNIIQYLREGNNFIVDAINSRYKEFGADEINKSLTYHQADDALH